MTLSDTKSMDSMDKSTTFSNCESNDYKQLAAMIVDNLLTRAVSKASEHIFTSKDLRTHIKTDYNGLDSDLFAPTIQIDLVGTRTPSPEEENQIDWSTSKKRYRFKAPVDQQSTSMDMDTDISINDFELSDRENDSVCRDSNFDNKSIDFDQIKDFAKEYVENVVVLAFERFNSQTKENEKILLKNSRSDNQCFESCNWMTRIRQIIVRQLMRSSCLCKSKQQFRHKKS